MHMYRLQGSYHAMGVDYGLQLRATRVPLLVASKTKLEFAAACEPHVRACVPELLDEMAGIAEGGGYALESIMAAAITLNARPACSAVAIAGEHTADGKPLFGRNHDWNYAVLQHTALCHSLPDGALASLGCNDFLVGRMGGVNAAGVAIAIASVEGGRDHPGVMFNLAARAVLDRCHTTAEAVALLESIRHARAINFLVADAGGTIARVEASPPRTTVIPADKGFAAITNHFQSEAMAGIEYVRKRPRNSLSRLRRAREWFLTRQNPLALADLQALLSTNQPRGLAWTPVGRGKRFGTVWSWTARLGDPVVHVAAGPPAVTPYRAFDLAP